MVNADDIQRAMKKFYCEFNSILRKFSFTDLNVKFYLFKYYCMQIYGSDLWLDDRRSVGALKQFAVGYHKAIKKLLGLSSHESNHFACQEARMLTFNHMVNKSKITTAIRLFNSPCDFFSKILPFLSVSSYIRLKIDELCFKQYDVERVFENDIDAMISRIIFVQNHEETMR